MILLNSFQRKLQLNLMEVLKMKIDLTLEIGKELLSSTLKKAINEDKAFGSIGHLGTHFDVMDKEFPLDYIKRRGKIFNVCHIRNNEISLNDIDLNEIEENDFIIFTLDT